METSTIKYADAQELAKKKTLQRYLSPTFAVVIFYILIGCIPAGANFSPESATTQELIQNEDAIPNTIKIHQNHPRRQGHLVLASYLRIINKEQMSCEAIYEMNPSASGWQISDTGTSCNIPPNTDDVTLYSGTLGISPDNYNYAFGLVRLKTAKIVEITWQDGVIQRAPVVNNSYLILREGKMKMVTHVEVLDAADKRIHEIEIEVDVQELP